MCRTESLAAITYVRIIAWRKVGNYRCRAKLQQDGAAPKGIAIVARHSGVNHLWHRAADRIAIGGIVPSLSCIAQANLGVESRRGEGVGGRCAVT